MVITSLPSAVPSKVITFFSCGSSERCSLIFAICSSFSAKTIWHSESLRMYAVSSPLVLGYTVVVAPDAHITARSARIHS